LENIKQQTIQKKVLTKEENMNTADKNIVFNTKKGKKIDLDAPLLPGR